MQPHPSESLQDLISAPRNLLLNFSPKSGISIRFERLAQHINCDYMVRFALVLDDNVYFCDMISVTIIGGGNVATHLFKAFNEAEGVRVVQWCNRTLATIEFCNGDVPITDRISELDEADVYVLAVSDDVIKPLSHRLPFENRLVVHTSGSVGIHDIDKRHRKGVLYPLQTFSKGADLNFCNVPICLEAIESVDYHRLKALATAIGSPTKKVNSNQRGALHLAAVFVNNFTNQLYRIAHEITESERAEFEMLKPLILETAKKVQFLSPYMAQTGPAKRNDVKTLKRHVEQLRTSRHQAVYEILTKSIQYTHGHVL